MSSLTRSSLPALVSDAHFYVSGNVTVHPSAAIAPGVMLQADPDSHLIVAAGVCIGVGCVLHAHGGLLELEAGSTLGSGVLIVGRGKIGANACIGAMTTIIDSSVPAKEMVSPGSLIGDRSRQVVIVEASTPYEQSPASPSSHSVNEQNTQQVEQSAAPSPAEAPNVAEPETPPPEPAPQEQSEPGSASESAESGTVRVVYGQTYVQRMMVAMFPHRSPLNQTPDQES